MSNLVVNNSLIKCSYGAAPVPITVIPMGPPVSGQSQLVATVNDIIPMVNIKPFGICNSPSNPMGMGKPTFPTPCPCIPTIPSPWSPASTVLKINGQKALLKNASCKCIWSGSITVVTIAQQVIESK